MPAATRWVYDALGNCVCLMSPEGRSEALTIVSQLTIERFPAPLAPLRIDNPHTAMPIVYARGDRTILDPFIDPATDDPNGVLLDWVRAQAGGAYEPALDFLQRLNRYIHQHFDYRERDEEGTQTPAFTVTMGSGTCRDFAWLMVEALRRLGYAARFVKSERTMSLSCAANSRIQTSLRISPAPLTLSSPRARKACAAAYSSFSATSSGYSSAFAITGVA